MSTLAYCVDVQSQQLLKVDIVFNLKADHRMLDACNNLIGLFYWNATAFMLVMTACLLILTY